MFVLIGTVSDHNFTASFVSLIGVLENAELNTFDGHIVTLLVEGLLDVCFVFSVLNNGILSILSLRVDKAVVLKGVIHHFNVMHLKIKASIEL